MFHSDSFLDLRVWHFSSWILVLTLQYMQCKFVFMFIPTWPPQKPDRSRMKQREGNSKLCLFLWKSFKNSKYVLRCENVKMTITFRTIPLFQPMKGYTLANATYPTCMRNVLEKTFMLAIILRFHVHAWFVYNLYLRTSKNLIVCVCVGSSWW
jgi:hypothetical protein